MAQLLHRLGLGAARRPLLVVLAWLIALATAVGSYLAFGGTLASSVTIPGTPTAQVTDRLKQEFPDAARGTGQVVFTTDDGKPFTDEQRQRISEVLGTVRSRPAVADVVDPFDVQRRQDDGRAKVEDADRQLAQGRQGLVDGRARIDDGRRQLTEGQKKLDDGQAQLDAAERQLADGQSQLDAARADLDARGLDALPADATAPLRDAEAQLADGRAQLQAGRTELARQEALLDAKEEQGRAAAAQLTPEELAADQEQLAAGQAQLADARAQLEAGRAKLDASEQELQAGEARAAAGREQALAAARAELDKNQQKLDAGRAEQAAGAERLAAGRAELEANRARLDQAEKDLADGARQLEDGAVQAERGRRMLDLTQGYRTVSEDGTAAVGIVSFDRPLITVPSEDKNGVADALASAGIPGVTALPSNELSQATPQVVGPGEAVGLAIAAIVLVVMLGTLIGAGLPLVNALIGVGVGAAGSLAFSGAVEMMSATPTLGVMLGLAVGIDYALFIVNRHRKELRSGVPLRESIALANGTSGNAVVFAGLTVVIALVALNVTGIPFLGLMGTVGAACVTVAVLVAVTLTPALLSLVGPRILSRRERRALESVRPEHATDDDAHAVTASQSRADQRRAARAVRRAHRRATMSTPGAVATALACVGLLAAISIPFFSMRLGLPDGASQPVGSNAQVSYQTMADRFGEGANGPLVVTVDLPAGLDEGAATDAQLAVGEQLRGLEHVAAVVPAGFNQDRTMAMYQVLPQEGPNAVSTNQLVADLRGLTPTAGATDLGVAGMTSGAIDVSDKLAAALPLYLAVVVGLSLLVMVLVFRSLLVPLIATGGFILSVFAAMGAVVAVYQWGWLSQLFGVHHAGPVLSFLPTIMIGVLFGLAMDYQLFIASGMREAYVHGQPARTAVLSGLRAGRSVVVAAAIIMLSVFGGFVFSHDAMIRPMGFGLAVGVLLDAVVVRLVLMPALMHLIGDAAWWLPRWLDRLLPDVDVEGAQLERRTHADTPADGARPGGAEAGGGSHAAAGTGALS